MERASSPVGRALPEATAGDVASRRGRRPPAAPPRTPVARASRVAQKATYGRNRLTVSADAPIASVDVVPLATATTAATAAVTKATSAQVVRPLAAPATKPRAVERAAALAAPRSAAAIRVPPYHQAR